jgi:phage-related minor tail protein
MNSPTSLARQLQHLLESLSMQGREHLGEVHTDLIQTNLLLSEAIEKLGKSFEGMHASMLMQQSLIGGLQHAGALTPEVQATLIHLQRETDRNVSSTVTALQFQDMTSQLIGRAVRHIKNMSEVLEGIGAAAANLPTNSADAATLAMLSTINQTLDEKSTALKQVSRKAVAQTHMESGDIELF